MYLNLIDLHIVYINQCDSLSLFHNINEESRVVPRFKKWNYEETEELAKLKSRTVIDESDFSI